MASKEEKEEKTESPFKKWPYERALRDGKPGYKITGIYCPPEIAMLSEGLLWILGAFIVYASLYVAAEIVPDQYEHHYFWSLMIGGLIVNYSFHKYGLYRWLLALLFGPKLHVIIEPHRIRIGGLFGYKNYMRDEGLIIPIEMTKHKRADKEQEKFRKGILPRQATPYYCKSVQVVMRYCEKRIILASIYDDQERAEGLIIRLLTRQEMLNRGFGA